MDQISELKRDISPSLLSDLNKQLFIGERIVISLAGSMGEALAVSEKRAFVVRERASGVAPTCDVFAYSLSKVTGAMAISSGAGGYIELRLTEPVSDPDTARVYFPSSEEVRFKAAAEYLSKPIGVGEQPIQATVPMPSAPAAAPVSAKCAKCGSELGEHAIYCGRCGEQARTICMSCGDSTPIDSVFCEKCGRNLIESPTACPKCAARISRWMSYCPDCGSILQAVCVGCGASVRPDWTYCAMCGRQFGSDRLDPRCAGPAAKRIQQFREVEAANSAMQSAEPAKPAEVQPVAPPPSEPVTAQASAGSSAEARDQRGRELFAAEDYEGAIREFEAACLIDPSNAGYHCNLAVAYDECDRDEEALAEYEKTLEIKPNDLTALLYLGYMYSEADEFDKAQEVWGKILRAAPDSAEAQEVQQNLRHQGEL